MTRKGAGFSSLFLAGLVAPAWFVPASRTPLAIVFGIVLMVMLHEAGHFYRRQALGHEGHRVLRRLRPADVVVPPGRDRVRRQGDPARRLLRIIGMTNLEEVDPEDEPRTYRQARYRERLMVVLAGVTVNFVLAFLLFFVVSSGRGVAEARPPRFDAVVAGRPAAEAGLQPGDTIVAIDGQPINELGRAAGRDRADRRRARSCSPSSATAGRSTSRSRRRQRSGQGFLGVSARTTGVRARRPCSRRVPESFDVMGDVTGGTARARPALLAVGRRRLQRELHLRRAQGGVASRPERAPLARRHRRPGQRARRRRPLGAAAAARRDQPHPRLFNLMPLLPFDGGHAAIAVYEDRVEDRAAGRGRLPQAHAGRRGARRLPDRSLSAMFLDMRQVIGGRPVPILRDPASRGTRRLTGYRAREQSGSVIERRRRPGRSTSATSRSAAAAPVSVQSMTTTKTADVDGTLAQIYALAAAGCRHRALHVQRGGGGRGAGADRAPLAGADRRRHPLPVQARARRDGGRRAGAAPQPRQHPQARAHQGRRPRGAGPRAADPHRRERGQPRPRDRRAHGGATPEALVASARARARLLPRGRLRRREDLGEGVERAGDDRLLPAARRRRSTTRCTSASPRRARCPAGW